LLFTNCVMYQGTNSASDVQGLDGVTVELTVGNSAVTTTVVNATAQVASNGTWWASVTLPSIGGNGLPYYAQIKIVDASTNSYIYPWLKLLTKNAL
jgi:hypothetical protein